MDEQKYTCKVSSDSERFGVDMVEFDVRQMFGKLMVRSGLHSVVFTDARLLQCDLYPTKQVLTFSGVRDFGESVRITIVRSLA